MPLIGPSPENHPWSQVFDIYKIPRAEDGSLGSLMGDQELKEKYQPWVKVGLKGASLKLSPFTVKRESQRSGGVECGCYDGNSSAFQVTEENGAISTMGPGKSSSMRRMQLSPNLISKS